MEQVIEKTPEEKRFISLGIHIPLWVAMAGFFLLLFVRDLGGINVPRIVYTVWLSVCFLLSKDNQDFALLVSTMGFNTRLDYNELTLIFVIIFLFRRLRFFKMPMQSFLFFGVLVIELCNCLIFSGDLMDYLRFAVMMFTSFLLLLLDGKKEDYLTIFSAYITGLVMTLADVLILTFRAMSWEDFFNRGYRLGEVDRYAAGEEITVKTTNFNPNMLAALVAVAIYLLFMLYYVKRISAFLAFPVGAFILLGGLLTEGRTMLLSLAFFLVFLLFATLRSLKSFFKLFLFLAVATVVVLLLLNGPLAGVYERYLYRFTTEDVSNGRFDIWLRILKAVTSDYRAFFFGFGIKYYAAQTGGSSAHNTYIEVLASWGVLGFAAIASFTVFSVRLQMAKARLYTEGLKRIPLIYFAPLLAFLFSLFGTHLYTITIYTFLFSLVQVSIRLSEFDAERFLSPRQRALLKKEAREEKRRARREKDAPAPVPVLGGVR